MSRDCPSRSALHRVAPATTTSLLAPVRHRRPFSHKARSPQVRTQSFPAQSSHLRHLALTTGASQSLACSPRSVPPHMRFVFLDSRFRFTLPPHARSPSRSCASLRSLWSARGRTCTSKIAPMLGAPKEGPHEAGLKGWSLMPPGRNHSSRLVGGVLHGKSSKSLRCRITFKPPQVARLNAS
jgi:hypothetical protein